MNGNFYLFDSAPYNAVYIAYTGLTTWGESFVNEKEDPVFNSLHQTLSSSGNSSSGN